MSRKPLHSALLSTATVLAGSLLFFPAGSRAQIVTQTFPSVADAYVQGDNTGFDANYGHTENLSVRFFHTGNFRGNSRHAYIRFDLSDIAGMTVTDAAFVLRFSSAANASYTFNVFALNYGDPGELWVEGNGETNVRPANGFAGETPPDPITWRNAPGNDINLGGGQPGDTDTGGNPDTAAGLITGAVTLIDTFDVTVTTGDPTSGTTLGLLGSNANLVSYLNERGANNNLTLILTLQDNQNSNFVFASSRHDTLAGPQLEVTAIPEPATTALISGIGALAIMVVFRRRLSRSGRRFP